MTSYRTNIAELNDGNALRFTLLADDVPLSWSAVIEQWQNVSAFRSFFTSILVDVPFPAYFWETPPVTSSSIDQEFEFVLVNSQQLAGIHTDQHSFANRFASAQHDASVIQFANLGGDATLVVPCPGEPLSAYSQLATFSREAPVEQQHELWKLVGATIERQLGENPVWVSTSGLGVYWVHIRLDAYPKYYTHESYRHA